MKKKLMSWSPNLTDRNKWERLARTQLGTLVAASVHFDEVTKFTVNVVSVEAADDVTKLTKGEFATVQAAKDYADQCLTHYGYTT